MEEVGAPSHDLDDIEHERGKGKLSSDDRYTQNARQRSLFLQLLMSHFKVTGLVDVSKRKRRELMAMKKNRRRWGVVDGSGPPCL